MMIGGDKKSYEKLESLFADASIAVATDIWGKRVPDIS